MANNFESWYKSIPVITRTYLTLSVITSAAVTFDLLSPFHLYLNFQLVFKQFQFWRLLTNFLFFDKFSINFIFHVYFLYIYCRRLEEHSFHGRSADFLNMILFGSIMMLIISPFLGLPFLSQSLVIMVLYVWSRLNPHQNLRIYGLFTVAAPYLAYVLLGLSVMLGGSFIVDLLGIFVGHIYFYLVYVLDSAMGIRLLTTPKIIKLLFPDEVLTASDHDHDADRQQRYRFVDQE
eukprot:GEZU01005796.1.p1 GENE.GEZU01005796.1~~GEZU01005796.1.p1  ORF type:complete len:234 (-),score=24.20 GEZU01005796.1:164-865(-)